jgi:hypothetical protein
LQHSFIESDPAGADKIRAATGGAIAIQVRQLLGEIVLESTITGIAVPRGKGTVMFTEVYDNFRQATEATVQLQQEMFKTWINLWPGVPVASKAWPEQVQQFHRKWAESVGEILKRQREVTAAHFKAGLANIERTFQLAESKTPEELRAKTLELWKKCFDDLRQLHEAQLRGFEFALDKWADLTAKATAGATAKAAAD